MVITTARLHSTKSELRFCTGSNSARGVSEVFDGGGYLIMVPTGNEAQRLSSVNHTTKNHQNLQPNMSKIKALSPLPFPGKIWLLFSKFRLFLPRNRNGSQIKELESKFVKSYLIHTIPSQLSVKKILIQTFSNFAATDHKGHFRKILTRTFKSGCFS